MKNILPLMTAGALLMSGAVPVMAEETTEPTEEVDKTQGTEGEGETTTGDKKDEATLDEAKIAEANKVLEGLKGIDVKILNEAQAEALQTAIANLEQALKDEDAEAVDAAIESGNTIIAAVEASKSGSTVDEAVLNEAKDILDKSTIGIEQYKDQWSAEQLKKMQDATVALQTAVTAANDEEAIKTAVETVKAVWAELGVDVTTISAENPPVAQPDAKRMGGAANAGTNTGIASAVMPLASGLSVAAVAIGGLTYKIKKSKD